MKINVAKLQTDAKMILKCITDCQKPENLVRVLPKNYRVSLFIGGGVLVGNGFT